MMLFALVFLPFAAAPALLLCKAKMRGRAAGLVCAAELALALVLTGRVGTELALPALGLSLRVTGLGALLCCVACTLWLGTALTSPSYFSHHGAHRARYDFFWLITLGALCGVFLAGELLTLFVFFEVMSFTSWVWVAQNETPGALRAARVYLGVAVFGGMALLMGLYLLYAAFGTLDLAALGAVEPQPWLYAAGALMLVGFGAKAGMFPLHLWLPMAHPVAPAPASALLSGILTKSGVYGVLLVSSGLFFGDARWGDLLLVLGTVTMLLGAVLAVLSRDLKRTLACSSMSQIGFILVGAAAQCLLGHHNAIAVWGTLLHMLNHSLIKLVLFTAAGVVYVGAHSLDLDEVRGYGRGKPWLMLPFLAAALSIGGVPLWSGYVSKTLLHEALVEHIALSGGALYRVCEALFLFSGGLTAAYMTNLFVTLFVCKPARPFKPERADRPTAAVLALGALALTLGGLFPHALMEPLSRFAEAALGGDSSHLHAVHYFAWANLKGAAISLSIAAAVYFGVMRTRALPWLRVRVDALRAWLGQTLLTLGLRLLDAAALPARAAAAVGDTAAALAVRLGAFFARALAALGDAAAKGGMWCGAFCARLLASLGDWAVALGMKAVFFRAPRIVVPRRQESYAHERQRHAASRTLSLDLLAAGLGLTVVLVYLLMQ